MLAFVTIVVILSLTPTFTSAKFMLKLAKFSLNLANLSLNLALVNARQFFTFVPSFVMG